MLLSLLVSSAFAHGGRTDSNGGHNDNINGGYHYHNGGYSIGDEDKHLRYSQAMYYVEGEFVNEDILRCAPPRPLKKVGDSFQCNDFIFKVEYIWSGGHEIMGGRPLDWKSAYGSGGGSCHQERITTEGIKDPIICNVAMLSVSFSKEGRKRRELAKTEERNNSELKSEIKSLAETLKEEKAKLEKDILDLKSKRITFLEEYDLFKKDVASFDKRYSYFQSEVLSFRVEKEKFESDLIKFNDSKKLLYREESKDVCGRLAYKLYKKYKKNPKKYKSNIDSFAYKSKFATKCGGIKYYDLLVPALAAKKCGRLAKDIERSYNSNPKYYGDLSSAAKHYSFDLYCPSVKYEDILFEAKLVE